MVTDEAFRQFEKRNDAEHKALAAKIDDKIEGVKGQIEGVKGQLALSVRVMLGGFGVVIALLVILVQDALR